MCFILRGFQVNGNVCLFLAGFALAVVTTAAGVGSVSEDAAAEAPSGLCAGGGSGRGGHWAVGACALDAVKTLDSSVFVLVLLPPLIYESSSSVDFYVFRRTFNSIFWLAAPGVALSAVLHALAFGPCGIDAGWTFSQSLTLGSILAATDPVSVWFARAVVLRTTLSFLFFLKDHQIDQTQRCTIAASLAPSFFFPSTNGAFLGGGGAARAPCAAGAHHHHRQRKLAQRRHRHGKADTSTESS